MGPGVGLGPGLGQDPERWASWWAGLDPKSVGAENPVEPLGSQ